MKVISLLLVVVLLFAGCGTAQTDVKISDVLEKERQTGDLVNFHMENGAFRVFISNPSMKIIDRSCRYVSLYRIQSYQDKTIKRIEHFTDKESTTMQLSEGVFRIGNIPKFRALVNVVSFIGDKGEIEAFLMENGISCDVIDAIAITANNNTPIVWISSQQGMYFLTVNEYQKDYLYDPYSDEPVYRAYTHQQMIEKVKSGEFGGRFEKTGDGTVS